MDKSRIAKNSIRAVAQYRENPFSAETFEKLRGKINKESRRYLMGKICMAEKALRKSTETANDANIRMGEVFGYAESSIREIITYAKAIDHFFKTDPNVARDILSGESGISSKKVAKLAGTNLEKKADAPKRPKNPISVKDMPSFDPDGVVSTLSYTIPSWTESIDRAFMNIDFDRVSLEAGKRLQGELLDLLTAVEALFEAL